MRMLKTRPRIDLVILEDCDMGDPRMESQLGVASLVDEQHVRQVAIG